MVKTYTTADVFFKFRKWYEFAKKKYQENKIDNYNAFVLSTSINNIPDSRVLLLKDLSIEGFIFYTNEHSKKGQQIIQNKHVAMLFYWPIIKRQIRIIGHVENVAPVMSDSYFNSRPYLSKIGAWASKQSEIMPSTLGFYKDIAKYSLQFPVDVPRPNHWHGFQVMPVNIEFWKEGNSRLHLRESFTKDQHNSWNKNILYP
ncbi:Pyridoxine/pyridoxamine 5'-phosphate oxidase [Candidatus Hepatincola sp. Av]